MRILLTGASGDLGTLLIPELLQAGHDPVNFDIQKPRLASGSFFEGSITDRAALHNAMQGVDMLVHIAAWHGIHEFRGDVDADTFWDVNVTGTYNVFEAAIQAGVRSVIYMSSTSVDEPYSLYGHSKVLGEQIAHTYHKRHGLPVLSLRPRAFIPHWNRYAYSNFVEWAQWFWRGAVHIQDVRQATMLAIQALADERLTSYQTLNLDGAYEFSAEDLANWDQAGAGTSFRRYYAEYEALAASFGLDITQKPDRIDIGATVEQLGYAPQYSLRNLLMELEQHGLQGPPQPF